MCVTPDFCIEPTYEIKKFYMFYRTIAKQAVLFDSWLVKRLSTD